MVTTATEEAVQTSVCMTRAELEGFLASVEDDLGDPSASACLLSVRYCAGPVTPPDMVARWNAAIETLLIEFVDAEGTRALPLDVSTEGPVMSLGRLMGFHIRKIRTGVWCLAPSLNIPEVIHAFVVIHDVPDPAPWERRVVLA